MLTKTNTDENASHPLDGVSRRPPHILTEVKILTISTVVFT